ncbi:MAG: ATP-dependent helicase [Lachnospiraceae bacterium]|nr:ATP-dependent helicase [Lachnospiraceae bacterium]
MNYNQSQQEAIRHMDGPMLVLAGPGSGKTAVITQRTVNLIENGVDPSGILVITFTKAAALQMRERFLKASGQERSPVTFGTFHAVFFQILKLAYHYDRSNIIPEETRYNLMREILSYQHLECEDEKELIADLLGDISRVKNEQIPLEHFYCSHCGEEIFRKIYREYDKRLRQNRLMDFDDMLVYTYELFSRRPDILSAWQSKYRYILIDEFQDINGLQWEIMKMMAEPDRNLFAVGDDDQSIYRFRGSKPEIMLGFNKDYPEAKIIYLNVNYRCASSIVTAAGKLIACNEDRYAKEVKADFRKENALEFRIFEEQRQENTFVAEEIVKAHERGLPYREMAVLFRTNLQPGPLMEQLLSRNLPFRAKDKIPNIYEHWIARDIFTYIRIARGSNRRTDYLSIINKPKRYIGRDSLCDKTVDFDTWIRMYDEQPWIAERIEKLWCDVKLVAGMNPYGAVNYIRRGIGYDDYIAEYADYRGLKKEELYEVADEILAGARGFQSFEEWFDHIREYTLQLEQMARQESAVKDSVVLSTLHSAKGLEFRQVFLVDVNEGLMPYKKAVLKQEIEEERRLFYVGMTRAKERLVLCCVKKLRGKEVEPSRFIREAGT